MTLRKTFFTFALILILFCASSPPANAASYTEKQQQAGFFFMEEIDESELRAYNFLFMSEARINGSVNASLVAIGSSVSVSGTVDGIILTLFTKTVSTGNVKYGIINLKYFALPVDLLAGLWLLAVFKDFFEQSAAYFIKNEVSTVKFGIYGYLMSLILIGIFFISVSGAVVALAGILALFAISFLGNIPLAVTLGYKLLGLRLKSYNIYLLFAAGIVVIDIIRTIPAVGEFTGYVVLPLLSLGVFSVHIIHKYFYRAYVFIDFEKNGYNREKMKSIILKSIDADRRQ